MSATVLIWIESNEACTGIHRSKLNPDSVLHVAELSVADRGLRFARIGVGFRCIFFFQSTDPMNAGACVEWGVECNEASTGKAVLEDERGALA